MTLTIGNIALRYTILSLVLSEQLTGRRIVVRDKANRELPVLVLDPGYVLNTCELPAL